MLCFHNHSSMPCPAPRTAQYPVLSAREHAYTWRARPRTLCTVFTFPSLRHIFDCVCVCVCVYVCVCMQAHESVSVSEAAAVWEEERRVSRYAADLPQLDPEGKKISPNPKDWRCEETGATENLWLNLSTGFIGSGRQVRISEHTTHTSMGRTHAPARAGPHSAAMS